MQNEISKTQTLTKQRRQFIDQLQTGTEDLLTDTLRMAEMLEAILTFKNTVSVNFYINLQLVFDRSIKENPHEASKYFNNYSRIMRLFMSLLTNHDLIENKVLEYDQLAKDLETLENEN